MIQREDVAHLFKEYSLLQCEVDSRHIDLMNHIYALGFQAGKARARASVSWRINGNLWSSFIDEEMIP